MDWDNTIADIHNEYLFYTKSEITPEAYQERAEHLRLFKIEFGTYPVQLIDEHVFSLHARNCHKLGCDQERILAELREIYAMVRWAVMSDEIELLNYNFNSLSFIVF